MLLNAILLLISSSIISAMSSKFLDLEMYDNNVSHKYQFDENFRLHIMHSTPAAKIFTDGCRGRYFNTTSSSTMFNENKNRTFIVENIDEPIILGLFSLDAVSIILYVDEPLENSTDYVEITLGIDKNTNASISGSGNLNIEDTSFVKDDDSIPAMPFYIKISNFHDQTVVSEIRRVAPPFLTYTHKAGNKFRYFRIDHKGAIYSHYSCCELNCTRQVFHRISGCNKYPTQTPTTQDKIDLEYYHQDRKLNKINNIIFTGTYFVDHPENISFGARIKFYEYDDRPGNFYDIALTDTYATIFHFVNNKAKDTCKQTYRFPQNELLNPRTINITIHKSGKVSLYRTHESKSFLTYVPQFNGTTVKYMSFAKLLDDSVRYDFYYNCSAIMTYFNLTPIAQASKLFEKYVPRVHEYRYDLVQIFNETFNVNDKFATEINKAYHEFENVEIEDNPVVGNNGTSEDNGNNNAMKIAWKTLGSIGSFMFVGLLKWFLSFECIKNLWKDHDEETTKERQKITEKLGKGITKLLANDDD